jgi:hypothetical protein
VAWLITQIISVALMVFAGIVSIFTPVPARIRRICVYIFIILGIANIISIAATNEATPGSPHISDFISWIEAITATGRDSAIKFAKNHNIQLIVVFAVGIALGVFGPREYQKRKIRKWYSSYDIFKLADPNLMKDAVDAEEEIQQIIKKIKEVQQQREALRVPFGGAGPIKFESEALEVLRTNASEASARNSAIQEVRERAQMRTLQDMYEKLKVGKLIAKGYLSPVDSRSKKVEIPAGLWKFIRFNGDYTEASNNNVKYVGIEVAGS